MSNKRAMIRRAIAAEEKEKNAAPVNKIEKARQEGMVQGYKHGMDYATMATIRLCTTAYTSALKKEHGFGKKRLMRILEQYMATLHQFIDDPDHEVYLRQYIEKHDDICLDDITGVGIALDSRRKVMTPALSEEYVAEQMSSGDLDKVEIGQAVLSAYDDKSKRGRVMQ